MHNYYKYFDYKIHRTSLDYNVLVASAQRTQWLIYFHTPNLISDVCSPYDERVFKVVKDYDFFSEKLYAMFLCEIRDNQMRQIICPDIQYYEQAIHQVLAKRAFEAQRITA